MEWVREGAWGALLELQCPPLAKVEGQVWEGKL